MDIKKQTPTLKTEINGKDTIYSEQFFSDLTHDCQFYRKCCKSNKRRNRRPKENMKAKNLF